MHSECESSIRGEACFLFLLLPEIYRIYQLRCVRGVSCYEEKCFPGKVKKLRKETTYIDVVFSIYLLVHKVCFAFERI